MDEVLIIVCTIIFILIWFIVSKKFAEIAEMKGHKGSAYFWFTFLMGLVGMLMVIALPCVERAPKPAVNTNETPPSSDATYYVAVKGQRTGPFTLEEMAQMAAGGNLPPSGYVWKKGMQNWSAAETVPELQGLFNDTSSVQ
ncbi:MAG: DUF4339 domain-containing protein [Clostridia bacterium]|nr:DUF4339 domain-containing protein [Clostridia bacterium]